ncbi:hypothetical protein U1Q18_033333 [Sarracenia purpurea var. burkii]
MSSSFEPGRFSSPTTIQHRRLPVSRAYLWRRNCKWRNCKQSRRLGLKAWIQSTGEETNGAISASFPVGDRRNPDILFSPPSLARRPLILFNRAGGEPSGVHSVREQQRKEDSQVVRSREGNFNGIGIIF